MSANASPLNDDELLTSFEQGAIPHETWDHRAHVKVAYLLLIRFSPEEALSRMRAGLHVLNAAHRVPDALDRGHHDTITQAWMRIVHATIRAHGAGAAASDTAAQTAGRAAGAAAPSADAFCDSHSHLLQRTLLRLFYSRGRLMSLEAKRSFVEPDIAPLPPWP